MRKVFAGALVAVAWLVGAQVAVAQPGFTPVPGSPFATGANPQSVAFSPDGSLLAVADAGSNDVALFQVSFEEHLGYGVFPLPGSQVATGVAPVSVAFVPTAARQSNPREQS